MKLSQCLAAEFIGSAGLLIVVVGSGIMGENLSQGNMAIALLANSIATGAGLYSLIQTFDPISAHFNPAVSFVKWLEKELNTANLFKYVLAQSLGAIVGVFVTHAIFGQSILQLSRHDRGDLRYFFSEIIATFGLVAVIGMSGRKKTGVTPAAVALYITSAYWCTSSTSFANPAVSIARSLTDSFSGILWTGVVGFIVAQLIGAGLAHVAVRKLTQ